MVNFIRKYIILMLSCFLIFNSSYAKEKKSYDDAIDYARETGYLWGVYSLSINEDGTITLFDSISGDAGPFLGMFDANHNMADSVTIGPGEGCILSDGHHVTITYKLQEVRGDKAKLLIEDKFDARAFGAGINKERGLVSISAYKKAN